MTPNNLRGLKTPNFFNTSAAIGTVALTGFEIIKIAAVGATLAMLATKSLIMEALMLNKSALVIPGFLGTPAGIITKSVPCKASVIAVLSSLFAG